MGGNKSRAVLNSFRGHQLCCGHAFLCHSLDSTEHDKLELVSIEQDMGYEQRNRPTTPPSSTKQITSRLKTLDDLLKFVNVFPINIAVHCLR